MMKSAFQPTEKWCPDDSKVCMQWNEFKENRRREIDPNETLCEKYIRVFVSGQRKRTTETNAILDTDRMSMPRV